MQLYKKWVNSHFCPWKSLENVPLYGRGPSWGGSPSFSSRTISSRPPTLMHMMRLNLALMNDDWKPTSSNSWRVWTFAGVRCERVGSMVANPYSLRLGFFSWRQTRMREKLLFLLGVVWAFRVSILMFFEWMVDFVKEVVLTIVGWAVEFWV